MLKPLNYWKVTLDFFILLLIVSRLAVSEYSAESEEQSPAGVIFGAESHSEEESDEVESPDDEKCPPSVPISASNHKLCEEPPCLKDEDCSSLTVDSVCCFNGCIFSCVPKMEPPKQFDWTEETEMRNSFVQRETYDDSAHFENSTNMDVNQEKGSRKNVSVELPGGCLLTDEEYRDLEQFRRYKHIHACVCTNREVVCGVNDLPDE